MAGAAFRFRPADRPTGGIGCIGLLGNNAFERKPAGRAQDGVAASLEMFDIANARLRIADGEKRFQSILSFYQRKRSQILAAIEQEIEGEEDKRACLAF